MDKNVSLVKLTTAATEWQADRIVDRLREEGIAASATGGFTAGFRAEAPGMINVLIDSRDIHRALQVVQAIEQDRCDRSRQIERGAAQSHPRHDHFSLVAGLIVVGVITSLLLLGPYRAVGVLALAAVIIVPAIWLRQRWTPW